MPFSRVYCYGRSTGPPSGGPFFGPVVSTLLACHQLEIEASLVVKHTEEETTMPNTLPPTKREIQRSILAVIEDNPIDTLPFIASSLHFIGKSLDTNPQLSDFDGAEAGGGYIVTLLANAIQDVEKALNKKYRFPEENLDGIGQNSAPLAS